jgi:hypothetical protein
MFSAKCATDAWPRQAAASRLCGLHHLMKPASANDDVKRRARTCRSLIGAAWHGRCVPVGRNDNINEETK